MKLSFVGGVASLLLASLVAAADDYRDAATAFEHGDAAAAQAILDKMLAAQPNDPAALGLLGAVLDAQKKYGEADRAYRRALKAAPNSAAVLNNFGNHLLATGDTAAARTEFLRVIAIRPGHPNANLQLAVMAADSKNGAGALRYLDRLPPADQASPQCMLLRMRALYLAGRDKDAGALLARLSDGAAHNPRMAFSTGLALAAAGKYAEAETFFARTLDAEPGDFDVLYNLGLAASHAGHNERARDVLQMALAKRTEDIDTMYNLAVVQIDLKQRAAGLALLAEAARLDPSHANVQLTLADTASALGYYNDAALAYERYLKLVPGDLNAQREHAFMLAVGGNPEAGIPALQAFVRAQPRDATAHYEIAVLEMNSDPADAQAHLERALVLQPGFGPARFGRGVLNYTQAKFSASLPDFEFAAARYPDNASILDRLGQTYMQLERSSDAVKVLRNAAELSPKDGRILMHLSRALADDGQKAESRAVLERFRALDLDRVNRVPPAGFVELIGLPPEQLYAQYRAEVERRLRKDPQDAALNMRYLKLLLGEDKTDEAEKAAAQLLGLKPPAALAAEAGRALLDAGIYEESRTLLEYAASSTATADVQLDLAIALSHTAGAEPALERLERVPEPQRSGDYYLARAEMLDAAGRGDEALAALQRALDGVPTRAGLYEQAAGLLVRNQRPADAERLFAKAAQALPDNPKILLLQAAMLAFAQHAGEAERVLKQIQNRWPQWAPSYATHGILLEGQKRSEEAKAQLETALALGAGGANVYYYLAKATFSATPDRIDEAAKSIGQAIALAPADPWAQALAGRIAYAKQDYTGAVEHLREAIRLRPNYIQARFTLTQAYTALGRTEDAAREAEEVRRLREANPNTDEDAAGMQQALFPRR